MTLRPDPEWVAVRSSDLGPEFSAKVKSLLEGISQDLGKGMKLVELSSIPSEFREAVLGSKASSPVFRDGETRIISLPEVRIEVPDADDAETLSIPVSWQWLGEQEVPGEVISEGSGRLVVAPVSGYGPDAVALAGNVAKVYKGVTATPRLIRVVPRPQKKKES